MARLSNLLKKQAQIKCSLLSVEKRYDNMIRVWSKEDELLIEIDGTRR